MENIARNNCQDSINMLKAETLNEAIQYDKDNLLPV